MTTPTVIGCDVSIWQDNNSTPQQIDFTKMVSAGASFVFIKASQGSWMDQDLIYNWSNAKRAGMLRGAYHFLTFDVSPITQADYYWSLMRGDSGELPLVADFEYRATGLTRSTASSSLKLFMERLQVNSGRLPMIYTSPGFWNEFGTTDTFWAKYPLWLGHYTSIDPLTGQLKPPTVPSPWNSWLFWQYTSHGDGLKYGAESLNIDMDYFAGTLEQLYAMTGRPLPVLTWEVSIDAWARENGYTGVRP